MADLNYLHSEKYIEKEFCKAIRQIGGKALKYYNHLDIGYPDRIVLLPHGRIVWAEMKSTGDKPTKVQLRRHAELRAMGFTVYVIDSIEGMHETVNQIGQHIKP